MPFKNYRDQKNQQAKSGRSKRRPYKTQDDLSWSNNADATGQSHSRFIYDANGNTLMEKYSYVDGTGAQRINQTSWMTYDERNRLQSVRDNDYSLDYEYDELGNRRHVHGVFSRRLLDSNGVPIVNPNGNQTQDDWKREKMPEGF